MKRFRNRLAALERIRELDRDQRRAELAQVIGELQRMEQAIRDGRQALDEAERSAAAGPGEGDSGLIKQWAAWCGRRRSEIDRLRDAARGREARLEEARAAYREASARHRALEELRRRRYRAWRQEADRHEDRFLSETYLQRATGKRTEEEN